VIPLACWQPHLIDREANETSRHSSGNVAFNGAARSQSNLTEGSL
jgi:hypothetical protein